MKEKAKILTVVSFLLLLVAVLGLIVWGNATHKEAGFSQICWYRGQAHWPERMDEESKKLKCADQRPLKWRRYPLSVVSHGSEPWQKRALVKEIKQLNREVGMTFVNPEVVYDTAQPADIRVVWDVPWEEKDPLGGCQIWELSTGDYLAQIKLYEFKYITSANHVLLHELGHCALGLAHDDSKISIMYRAAEDAMWYSGPKFRNITDHDSRLVRKHYGF